MGDIIGLDYNAVKFIMELYDIKDMRKTFERLLECFNIEMEIRK